MPNQNQPNSTPNQKNAPGIGGINDGSGRGHTQHQPKADQEVDHDSKRQQQKPNTQRESKKHL